MQVVILGNGVAGYSAAIRLRERQPDWRITMISGESTHPWSRPALMYVFMGHMRYKDTKPFEDDFWAKQRIDLVRDWVTGLDTARKQLVLHRGAPLAYDKLLLATGSKPNRFGWPGQDLEGVQGLYGLMDLKRLIDHCDGARRAAIVGGGLIGIELAEMLHSRRIHPTLLVREDGYWNNVLPDDESRMVGDEIRRAGIDLRLGAELERIEDDGAGRAAAAITVDGERMEAQIVGLTAGVSPNLDLARAAEPAGALEHDRGILVDDALRASADGVWAAGDCAEIRRTGDERNLVQQVWYTGKRQGRVAADSMAGDDVRYEPGTWYNSAKFLNLEYQTYGDVKASAAGQESLWWQSDDGRRGMRIALDGDRVAGFNVMGLRYRHEVCRRWIEEGRGLDHVLDHLGEANFDPEFEPRFEARAAAAMRGGQA